MKINVKNQTIISTNFSASEIAWKIEDSVLVLEYLKSNNKIILGGDILTEKMERNYDSWYYNVEHNQSREFCIERSIEQATEYISKYIEANGNAFYVIFVVE